MSMDTAATETRPDRWTAIKRGFRQRCPVCGKGHLFRSYLKLSDCCACCGEKLGEIRADDGPAWLTILVVGHIVVPLYLVAARGDAPGWVYFAVLGPLTVALTAALLPLAKGMFAALLWSMGMKNGVPSVPPGMTGTP